MIEPAGVQGEILTRAKRLKKELGRARNRDWDAEGEGRPEPAPD